MFCVLDIQRKKIRWQWLHDLGFIPFAQEFSHPRFVGGSHQLVEGVGRDRAEGPVLGATTGPAPPAGLLILMQMPIAFAHHNQREGVQLPIQLHRGLKTSSSGSVPKPTQLLVTPLPPCLKQATPGFLQKCVLWGPTKAEFTRVPGQSCQAGCTEHIYQAFESTSGNVGTTSLAGMIWLRQA